MSSGFRKLYRAAVLLLALALLFLFGAEATDRALRTKREEALLPFVLAAAEEFDVPPTLILSVIRTESDFKKDALSAAGAIGPMQLLPETFYYLRDECLFESLPDSALYDAATNVRYGTYYLFYLSLRFDSETAVLAAYNAGEGRVADWLQNPELSSNGRLLTIPFAETRAYVKRVQSVRPHYMEKYHLKE